MDFKKLEVWFRSLPKWLQDAARRIVQNGVLTPADFGDLEAICIAEVTPSGGSIAFAGLPTGVLQVEEAAKPLRLVSISGVQGINALCPTKPLELGNTTLTIVYGRNGAGKSGYVRLLKHACGARHPGDLLPNIFEANTKQMAANITFVEDGKEKTAHWNGSPIPQLKGVDIYDTFCGLVYVNEESEVAFEPWILRLFTDLTAVCETLGGNIRARIDAMVSSKPLLPNEMGGTESGKWYSGLNAGTTVQQVDVATGWSPEDEKSLNDISKRLAETDPSAKASSLRRGKMLVEDFVSDLRRSWDHLSDDYCTIYLQTKADAVAKRKAADEDANRVFEGAPLPGIGSESWRLLWEAARKYSTEHAYETLAFPNISEDARCVLCQQSLERDSRERLQAFEGFVKGELQRLAVEAEKKREQETAMLPEFADDDSLLKELDAAGVADDPVRTNVRTFVDCLKKRKATCITAEAIGAISILPPIEVLDELEPLAAHYESQALAYDLDAAKQNRQGLEVDRNELMARKWMSQQRSAIDTEIARLQLIELLEKAIALTNTKALSTHKSILMDDLITDAYVKRFDCELKILGSVRPALQLKKTRAEVGKVYHKIVFSDAARSAKTSDVLSEGEFRVVSLAAFLADANGRGAKTPFIFDDPISSLDQVYEVAIAQRLAQLSNTRQVIVFTHRLSLVSFLQKYAGSCEATCDTVCLSRHVLGEITDLPIDLKRTDKAANDLANTRLAAVKNAFSLGDEAYEGQAKAFCHDIRVLLERVVEHDLLNDVVRRFNPEVQTKKIGALAKITVEDCQFIDAYMTKYSRYEHSQSEEAPISLPTPDELEKDIGEISKFVFEVRKRNKEV